MAILIFVLLSNGFIGMRSKACFGVVSKRTWSRGWHRIVYANWHDSVQIAAEGSDILPGGCEDHIYEFVGAKTEAANDKRSCGCGTNECSLICQYYIYG